MVNDIGWKQFPVEVKTLEEWEEELEGLGKDYGAFLVEQAVRVSPLESA